MSARFVENHNVGAGQWHALVRNAPTVERIDARICTGCDHRANPGNAAARMPCGISDF